MADVVRANISRPYLVRLGMVSLFSFGLAFWCVYDGMVTYPAQRVRATRYIELLDESLASIRREADNASRTLAASRPPADWSANRWTEEIESVLLEQRSASTTEQDTFFLQLIWLYLNVPTQPTDLVTQADRLRMRATLRKNLIKFFNEPEAYSIAENDAVARTTTLFETGWSEECQKYHWSDEYPGEPKNPYAIDQQFYMAAGIVPFSLFFFITLLRRKKAWIEGDESGLRNSSGASLQFNQITSFDKKRWDKKGIAWVHYRLKDSKTRFLLDDCNFEYMPIRKIVRMVEANIDSEMITGGDPEPPAEPDYD